MKLFIAETGRTRRTDRERVISFNKDIFSESNQAAKNYTLKKDMIMRLKKAIYQVLLRLTYINK